MTEKLKAIDEQDTAYLNIHLWLQQALAHSAAGSYQNMHDKVATALHHLPILKPYTRPSQSVEDVGDDALREELHAAHEYLVKDLSDDFSEYDEYLAAVNTLYNVAIKGESK